MFSFAITILLLQNMLFIFTNISPYRIMHKKIEIMHYMQGKLFVKNIKICTNYELIVIKRHSFPFYQNSYYVHFVNFFR